MPYQARIPPIISANFGNGECAIDQRVRANFAQLYVVVDGHRIGLTPIENRLLCLLFAHRGRLLATELLATKFWSAASKGAILSLRAHICRLRLKIEVNPETPRYIVTKVGKGYYLP